MAVEPILLIMAAGMGSRYGGLKQMDPVGPDGEFILDYSLFDARRAGFKRAVVVIKREKGIFWGPNSMTPQLKDGKTVLVTAHGNSLRALYKYLNGVSREAILELNIPTGIPLLFELDDQLAVQSFRYLGDPEAAKKAAEAVANQGKAHG